MGYPSSRPATVQGTVRWRARYVWTLCAIVSLVTSKYLLIDSNFHFPLYIYLGQILAVPVVLALFPFISQEGDFESPHQPQTSQGWVVPVVVSSATAVSVALTLHAIQLFPNLTTIAMLSVQFSSLMQQEVFEANYEQTLSYLAELVTSHIIKLFTHFGEDKAMNKLELIRMLLLAACCGAILTTEYRLTPKGLRFSIPAAFLAGFARAIRIIDTKYTAGVARPHRADVLFCCFGLLVFAIWAVLGEATVDEACSAIRYEYAFLLIANIASSAVALGLGKSTIFPADSFAHADDLELEEDASNGDALSIIFIAGITGSLSLMVIRRSYTTYPQLLAFLIATLLIDNCSVFSNVKRPAAGARYQPLTSHVDVEASDGRTILEDAEKAEVDGHEKRSWRVPGFLGLSLAATWILFVILNFTSIFQSVPERPVPYLDVAFVPGNQLDLVISLYQEPLADIVTQITALLAIPTLMHAKIHIYTKDPDANTTFIQGATRATSVTILPNVGREGETYLYHIINRWDSLAKHTLFLQGDMHNPQEVYLRIRDYFDPARTGALQLGYPNHVCDCESCSDQYGWQDNSGLVPAVYSRVYGPFADCGPISLSYKGQFIASAARIRGVDKQLYEDLNNAFVNETSWAHSKAYLDRQDTVGKDDMSKPVLGYAMERLWGVVLQCAEGDISWKCPTLMSGSRIGGDAGDCQCYDNEDIIITGFNHISANETKAADTG